MRSINAMPIESLKIFFASKIDYFSFWILLITFIIIVAEISKALLKKKPKLWDLLRG